MSHPQIKKKIAALLAMTQDAGCSEAEAMAAAAKAAELMREHGLSQADIAISQASVRSATKGRGARDDLWPHVAHCTNTSPIYLTDTGAAGSDLVFVGREPGPEIAAYLFALLNRALDTAIADFRGSQFYKRRRSDATRRQALKDFTQGMVRRLAYRIREIFAPVVNRSQQLVAADARDRMFSDAKAAARSKPGKVRFGDAVLSGWAAGGKVNLAQGVAGGSAAPRRIGGV